MYHIIYHIIYHIVSYHISSENQSKYFRETNATSAFNKDYVHLFIWWAKLYHYIYVVLRCVIPVVCLTNGREENVVQQHN